MNTFQVGANNGDMLTAAAVQGLGITCQPDFIIGEDLAGGRLEELLPAFAMTELGIYALLPSNRQIPHRVRVLMDFLSERLMVLV